MDVLWGFPKVFTVFRYRAQWDFLCRPEGKNINIRIEFQDSVFLFSCHDGSQRE